MDQMAARSARDLRRDTYMYAQTCMHTCMDVHYSQEGSNGSLFPHASAQLEIIWILSMFGKMNVNYARKEPPRYVPSLENHRCRQAKDSTHTHT